MADEIRATPQNPTLGALAAALRKAQQFAGQYEVDRRIPLLGGTSVDELLSLPGAASLMEDVSYHGPRALIRGGNVVTGGIGTFRPDPRIVDVADVGLNVTPLGVLAGKGAVRGARALEDATVGALQRGRIRAAAAKVPQDTAYDPLRQRMEASGNLMYAVKPKGGNWLAGHTDYAMRPLRTSNAPVLSGEDINAAAGRDIFSEYRKAYDNDMTLGLHEWTRKNYPEVYAQIQGPEAAAADRFVAKKLEPYIRNEMGTPEDPVRALAERGVLHFDPPATGPMRRSELGHVREMEGFPSEGLGQTPLARNWEALSDSAINAARAGDYLKFMGDTEYAKTIEKNPWLKKVPPETKVYGTAEAETLADDLGFEHLIDELKNAMHPLSAGMPANLRIDPKDIDKITVPQAVERVAQINAWRAKQAAEAEKAGMLGNLQAKPRLADDSLQLSFVDKPGGAWVDIPDTVNEKGMALCNSIGKAGGWCTQQKWAAESYGSGDNRLAALVDSEGRPHAQAKITTSKVNAEATELGDVLTEEEAIGDQFYRNIDIVLRERGIDEDTISDVIDYVAAGGPRSRIPEDVLDILPDVEAEAERMLPKLALPKPDITELKPVGNTFSSERAQEYMRRDPEYKQKVTQSVLKFLNSGDWGKVNDLEYYNIVDLSDTHSVMNYLDDIYDGDRDAYLIFNAATDGAPMDTPRFMTRGQFLKFLEPYERPTEGFAGGGAVKALGKLVQKYLAKEGAETAAEAPVKEQKMLQGFYRGYAGDYDAARAAAQDSGVFVSPQRAVGEYYANKRAAQTGLDPHLEMILADPFAGRGYGHSTMGTGKNPPMITRARELKPEDVQDRTKLYAEGGAVNYDPAEIEELARSIVPGYAAGGLVHYDPTEIDTIVSRVKEELHG